MLTASSILKPVSAASFVYIKSIQKISINLSGVSTNTATITAVNTANTVIIYGGCIGSDTTTDKVQASLTLTNSTTVTANTNSTAANTTVVGTVVEFQTTAVNVSAQYGSITLGAGVSSATATITTVSKSFSAIFPLGQTTTGTSITNSTQANLELTNGTTVTSTRGGTTGAITIKFCVLEFAHAMINSIQHVSKTVTNDSNTSTTAAISFIDQPNTIWTYNGGMSASTGICGAVVASIVFAGTTSLQINRGVGTNSTRTYKFCVITFVAGVLNQAVQYGEVSLGIVTPNTANPISAVSLNQAFLVSNGYRTNDDTGTIDAASCNSVLTDSTTVTGSRFTLTANTVIVDNLVIEFT